jgi:hypothetical protein
LDRRHEKVTGGTEYIVPNFPQWTDSALAGSTRLPCIADPTHHVETLFDVEGVGERITAGSTARPGDC